MGVVIAPPLVRLKLLMLDMELTVKLLLLPESLSVMLLAGPEAKPAVSEPTLLEEVSRAETVSVLVESVELMVSEVAVMPEAD